MVKNNYNLLVQKLIELKETWFFHILIFPIILPTESYYMCTICTHTNEYKAIKIDFWNSEYNMNLKKKITFIALIDTRERNVYKLNFCVLKFNFHWFIVIEKLFGLWAFLNFVSLFDI